MYRAAFALRPLARAAIMRAAPAPMARLAQPIAIRSYAAAAGLSKDQISERVMEVMKTFEKVDGGKVGLNGRSYIATWAGAGRDRLRARGPRRARWKGRDQEMRRSSKGSRRGAYPSRRRTCTLLGCSPVKRLQIGEAGLRQGFAPKR